MFYTITNVQNGPCRLHVPINNPDGRLKVGLRSITYTVGWYNIVEGETIVYRENGGIEKTIRPTPGLYGFEDLREIVNAIDPSIQVVANKINGLVSLAIGVGWEIKFSDGLLEMLGLDDGLGGLWLATGFYLGDRPVNFIHQQQKPLMVYLDQINTTGNFLDGKPSTLLGMVGARYSNYGDVETVHFPKPEFRELICGQIYQLDVFVRDENFEPIDNHGLPICVVLEITN